ncbi:hypothetical protein [Streptomyces hundungensis]|uniref:hypothetical protein n=1 Tax=Streptomyces hundungensis TaxID=1077946 RepID=UPI0031E6E20F
MRDLCSATNYDLVWSGKLLSGGLFGGGLGSIAVRWCRPPARVAAPELGQSGPAAPRLVRRTPYAAPRRRWRRPGAVRSGQARSDRSW